MRIGAAANLLDGPRCESPHGGAVVRRRNEVREEPGGDTFVADINEVVMTGLNADAGKLVVEWWTV